MRGVTSEGGGGEGGRGEDLNLLWLNAFNYSNHLNFPDK